MFMPDWSPELPSCSVHVFFCEEPACYTNPNMADLLESRILRKIWGDVNTKIVVRPSGRDLGEGRVGSCLGASAKV